METYQVEKIIEDLIEKGLPFDLAHEIELLLINSYVEAEAAKAEVRRLKNILSWTENPERMGK